MQSTEVFAEVAVFLPVDQTFTYSVPEKWRESLRVGQRVLVPFGSRKLTGHVIDLSDATKTEKLKNLIEILDLEPVFSTSMLDFLRWVSSYYHHPFGEVLRAATPSGVNLASLRTVTLTAEGLTRFDPQSIDTPEEHVLHILCQKGALRLSALLKLEGVTEGLLARLQREGVLNIDQELQKVRVRVLKERIVRLTREGEGAQHLRGEKQKEILRFLGGQPEISLAALEKSIKGARGAVKRLAELGILDVTERETVRDPLAEMEDYEEAEVIELNSPQLVVLEPIRKAIREGRHETFLLHGVTGSGKTEVYLQAVQEIIERGTQAIILVPEISLTSQMIGRFRARFGASIAVMHSALSDGERYDQWRMIQKGEVKIAIGARSAIFAPFSSLGLIVVDEEHEASFKQENGLLYHARDLAVARGRFQKAAVILGSATPSVESFYKAKAGKYTYLAMSERVEQRAMPLVELIDMTKAPIVYRLPASQGFRSKMPIFSARLLDEIEGALVRGEQSVLFLNRRGYASFLLCSTCGEARRCPHCAISLTYYDTKSRLTCHYCDHAEPLTKICGGCEAESLHPFGYGTESVEEELKTHFPKARIARMDRDTTTKKGSHAQILGRVRKGEADILLGTQMVAKGHHFPNVTLVGVISADVSLHMPDFRAAERSFQLMTQVAGRAGRGDRPGKVLIQTYAPEHHSLTCASTHDFGAFFEREIEERNGLHYPPFTRLICIRLSAESQSEGAKAVASLREKSRSLAEKDATYGALQILGPSEAPLARLRKQFRWQMLIKSKDVKALHRYVYQLRKWVALTPALKALRLQVDVDPFSLM